jgi:NAD(P)-dependent dehydrogenase (short-subunit alcohol dehydrogenase family)
MRVADETVGVAGAGSAIAREFCKLLPTGVMPWCDRLAEFDAVSLGTINRFLVCTGYLAGKNLGEITPEEAEATWRRNFVDVARFCDLAFAANPRARICVLGSDSGFKGSYDMAYAGSKAALHLYVETKRLDHPEQQLVCLAPTIIADTAMTERRKDKTALEARGAATRHGRWLTAAEVAAQAYQALFTASPFLSNAVIRIGSGL